MDTLGGSDCAHQLVRMAQPNYRTCQLTQNAELVWHAVSRQVERSPPTGWHFTTRIHDMPGREGLAAKVKPGCGLRRAGGLDGEQSVI